MSPVWYELGFYIREDGIFHSHRRENLKFYICNNDSEYVDFITQTTRLESFPCLRFSSYRKCYIKFVIFFISHHVHMPNFTVPLVWPSKSKYRFGFVAKLFWLYILRRTKVFCLATFSKIYCCSKDFHSVLSGVNMDSSICKYTRPPFCN
jgi:hypothetical protein